MQKVLIALTVVALVASAHASTLDAVISREGPASTSFAAFQAFAAEYDRVYESPAEMARRFAIFQANMEEAQESNLAEPLAEYGITRFSDMTPEEFAAGMLINFDLNREDEVVNPNVFATKEEAARRRTFSAPSKSKDWRERINKIKDQKACGSCWAFSAMAAVEGEFVEAGYGLVDGSEQQLVDCEKKSGGCNGGLMDTAIAYLAEAGVYSQESYPYKAKNGKCHTESAEKISCTNEAGENVECPAIKLNVRCAHLQGLPKEIYTDYDCTEEDTITATENRVQSVAINATHMQAYRGGVADPDDRKCNPKGLNHGVSIVGFDEADGVQYFIIRNSWGTRWGEEGHYRLVANRGGAGACGVQSYQVEAVVA